MATPVMGRRSVTITVPVDTDYSCLFRNRPEPVEQVVRKYNDKNGDGERQPDTEPLIDTWTFWLDLDRDGVQDALEPTRTTDGGEARFTLLPTGRYQICEVTQAGWINTDPGAASTSPMAPCKETELIEPGGQPDVVRFGNDKPEPVDQVVRKYNDRNADGSRQVGTEPLIDTWTFWLDLDQDGVQDVGEPKRSTQDGEVTFSLAAERRVLDLRGHTGRAGSTPTQAPRPSLRRPPARRPASWSRAWSPTSCGSATSEPSPSTRSCASTTTSTPMGAGRPRPNRSSTPGRSGLT